MCNGRPQPTLEHYTPGRSLILRDGFNARMPKLPPLVTVAAIENLTDEKGQRLLALQIHGDKAAGYYTEREHLVLPVVTVARAYRFTEIAHNV